MQDFVAIDFETANGRRSSVCSVGIVIVRDGVIVDRFYSLIQPAPNYYTYWTTEAYSQPATAKLLICRKKTSFGVSRFSFLRGLRLILC